MWIKPQCTTFKSETEKKQVQKTLQHVGIGNDCENTQQTQEITQK